MNLTNFQIRFAIECLGIDKNRICLCLRRGKQNTVWRNSFPIVDFQNRAHRAVFKGDFFEFFGLHVELFNFLSIFFGSWAAEKGVATNYSFFRNETMDALLLKARRTTDPELRNNLYFQALRVWSQEMPLIPLVHAEQITVMRSEVDGFVQHPTWNVRLGTIDWEKP